jgi:DNA polymerase III sliding clamp (beta) subunit (PCNA family)
MAHEFQSDAMDKALGRVWHAVATDEERPILATVLFEGVAQGFRLVAADNYRIAIATLSEEDHSDFGRVALPRMYVSTLRAFLKAWKRTVSVKVEGERLVVGDSRDQLALRYMNGTFPNYASVIPNGGPVVGVNPKYLADTAAATKGLILKLTKGETLEAPFVITAEDYREAIMAVRVAE